MKRVLAVILSVALLSGCANIPQAQQINTQNGGFIYGVWLTYSELENMASGDFKQNFADFVSECKELGITDIFIHTTAFCDSIYDSQFYPKRNWAKSLDFDVLDFMIATLHSCSLKIHAWINPYRISFNRNEELKEELKGLKSDICRIEEGVYLNPASQNARKLIKNAVEQLMEKYDIDGIHFDDYFYPTTSAEFDKASYEQYKSERQTALTLEDYRRLQTSLLVSEVGKSIRANEKKLVFSISPAADIERNYTELYADIGLWCKEGFIDAVIPQLYFGFDYPNERFCFDNLLGQWTAYVEDSVPVYIGLAPYKLNTQSTPDKAEWENGVDIVSRQIEICSANELIKGVVLFSASSLFNKDEIFKAQKQNIKNILNKERS